MNTEKDLVRILTKILKLPKEKQALVVGFVEGVQYKEVEKPKEPVKAETVAAVTME